MESENPYDPPQSNVVLSEPNAEAVGAPLIPWEDSANYPGFLERVWATMQVMARPTEAGPSLGRHQRLSPAITYFLCVGLPLLWLVGILTALFGPANPGAALFEKFNIPQASPAPGMESVQKIIQVITAVVSPLFFAIMMAILGLINHAGLWLTRGLKTGRGVEVTYRALLYGFGTSSAVVWVFNLWVFLPMWVGLALLSLSVIAGLGLYVWQGVLLAKAHETDTWRGVLGVFLPWILLTCCCCGAIGAIAGLAAALKGAS